MAADRAPWAKGRAGPREAAEEAYTKDWIFFLSVSILPTN
jgi:hypothetical protein